MAISRGIGRQMTGKSAKVDLARLRGVFAANFLDEDEKASSLLADGKSGVRKTLARPTPENAGDSESAGAQQDKSDAVYRSSLLPVSGPVK